MKTNFDTLFEQTFISAQQKQPSVPADDIDAVQPDSDTVAVVAAPIKPDHSDINVPGNLEEEGEENSMAKSNLFAIYSDAKELHNIIQSGVNPETWMSQKIAVCADNLSSVLKAARYDMAKQSSCGHSAHDMGVPAV